jgi:multiple sugar transport system substrate-binding protein
MTVRRWRTTAAGVAAVALLAAGCGGDDDDKASPKAQDTGPVTLTVVSWAESDEGPRAGYRKVIAAFQNKYPNITVKSVPQPVDQIVNQVAQMSAGGNAPCVMQSQTIFTPTLQGLGLLEPLDDYAKDVKAKVQDAPLALATVKDKLYALPWYASPLGFYYNKTLMEKVGLDPNTPPKTIDEMTEQIKKARTADPNVIGLNVDTTQRSIGLDYNWGLMRGFGAEPVKDGKPNADTPEMRKYIEWLQMMIKEKHTIPGKKFGEFREQAANGTQLFMYDGTYFKGIVQGIDKTITDDVFQKTWGVTTLPGGADGKHFATSSDHHLAMVKGCKTKDAAWKFIEFTATDPQAIKDYVIPQGGLPVVKDVAAYPQVNTPILKTFVTEITPTLVKPPWGKEYDKTSQVIMSNLQRAFGNDSPDAIAKSIQEQLAAVYPG